MKSKKILITLKNASPDIQFETELTHQAWAKKMGWDWKVDDGYEYYCWWNLGKYFKKYDQIILVSSTCLVREDAPDITAEVESASVGLFKIDPYQKDLSYYAAAWAKREGFKSSKWKGEFYDFDVAVFSKQHSALFENPTYKIYSMVDLYSWLSISLSKYKVTGLSWKWNRQHYIDQVCGVSRLDSYIVNYKGGGTEEVRPIVQRDIKQWEVDKEKGYQYQQTILIEASCGLGDQVCSESVIRYMAENIYPEARLVLTTHHPRIFEHLPIEIYDYEQDLPLDDAYVKVYTCPSSEHTVHQLTSGMLYPGDHSALNLIRSTLPPKDKQIRIGIKENDIIRVNEMLAEHFSERKPIVVVHAGKWWASKTFPIEWWQEIVDRLDHDFNIVLVGKTLSEEQGYLPVECPQRALDLRDIATFDQYLTIIALSQVVISNDSSPIHIAGAFDPWIVLIATSKHPYHTLPFRNGSQDYKTKALYKRLLWSDLETRHTKFDIDTIDLIPAGYTIEDYLPSTDEVVKCIKNLPI